MKQPTGHTGEKGIGRLCLGGVNRGSAGVRVGWRLSGVEKDGGSWRQGQPQRKAKITEKRGKGTESNGASENREKLAVCI